MAQRKTTTDKTTWDGGFNLGKRIGMKRIAANDWTDYFEQIHIALECNERNPCLWYLGYVEGLRAARREVAA